MYAVNTKDISGAWTPRHWLDVNAGRICHNRKNQPALHRCVDEVLNEHFPDFYRDMKASKREFPIVDNRLALTEDEKKVGRAFFDKFREVWKEPD